MTYIKRGINEANTTVLAEAKGRGAYDMRWRHAVLKHRNGHTYLAHDSYGGEGTLKGGAYRTAYLRLENETEINEALRIVRGFDDPAFKSAFTFGHADMDLEDSISHALFD